MNKPSYTNSDDLPTPRLAAVIPAFNEAFSIAEVVRQIGQGALVIVVDDGSVDDTAVLARSAGAHVVRHPLNQGYDCALETGIRTAIALGCTYVVTMDADGQHDPTLIERFLTELVDGADLVVGERDRTQRWSEALFCVVGRVFWGLNDPLCGMKGYRLSIFNKVDSFNTYASIGTELAIRLIKGGMTLRQLAIKTKPREGLSRFGHGIKVNLRICKALWLGLICASV